MNTNKEFAKILTTISPKEFIGLAQFFNVKILTEQVDPETKAAIPRNAEDILLDILERYDSLGRSKRRELVRTLRRMHRE